MVKLFELFKVIWGQIVYLRSVGVELFEVFKVIWGQVV